MSKAIKVETVEEWIKKGGKVRKVDFDTPSERQAFGRDFKDNRKTMLTNVKNRKKDEQCK